MKKYYLILALCLILFNNVFAQTINKADKFGRRQGYWKIYLPSFADKRNDTREGFYYNDKLIGVWQVKNSNGEILKEEIFYDTTQSKMQEIKHFLNGNVQSSGFLIARPHVDSIRIFDPKVKKERTILTSTKLMREGKWSFYYENGILQSEGNYKADVKMGEWKYYNEKGELINMEDVNKIKL